ncbi:MAG TPA: response regulator [Ignavibacteriales bacterium]|nr:response regulator [Ignavibacteriales bacterium]
MNKDRILIVEDEDDTRFILERLLSKNNYEVKCATNGEEALAALAEYSPKVVVADWTMPKMDGLELCNLVKKNDRTKLIYFILLTARASLKDRVTGLDVGADDFLVKPIENQELLARIRSGIRIHNLQHELKSIEHNKAVIELACTIGHQINNPLSSLILSIQNLEGEIGDDKFKDDFMIINKAVERIRKFDDALKNLQNPEMVGYALDNKMLKIE